MTVAEDKPQPFDLQRIVRRRGFLRIFGVKVPKLRPVAEAPAYAKIPYITHGYRVGYNFFQCIASFLMLHNETLNVWTHFAGFCWFLYLLWDLFWYQDFSQQTIPEILAISIFMAAALSCMLFSTFYHLFMCHSQRVCECVLSLDLTGISLLIGGSYFPGVTLGFHCEPVLQLVYGGMATCILLSGIYLSQAKFEKHDIKAKGFALLTAVGAIPAAHWVINTPHCFRERLLPSLFGMFGFYGIGFVFYSSRFPECMWPGKFNYFLSSHQIWHVCVFAAVYVWYQNVMISKEIVDSDICVNACPATM